jgi:hypothetical protein
MSATVFLKKLGSITAEFQQKNQAGRTPHKVSTYLSSKRNRKRWKMDQIHIYMPDDMIEDENGNKKRMPQVTHKST